MKDTPLQLISPDGYRLGAHLYRGQEPVRANLVVGGATGVPQRFYRRFAEFASLRGFQVLTLDYRGIGESAPRSLRGFEVNFLDWARLDLACAVEHLARDSDLPLFMIGHSFGGHAFGLLPNVDRVRGLYTYATGAGWHGWMPAWERLRVQLMWNLVGPLLTTWKGYLAWSLLGMGEDLPLNIFHQWRKWCSYPHYFFQDPALAAEVQGLFARVRTPIVAANSLDDLWAPPASRNAFMKGYCNAPWQPHDILPRQLGVGRLGHMGYFRSQASALWKESLDWFEALP